jgi:hypothetical protein
LSRLLSRALIALAREFELAAAPDDPTPSIVLWSNFLRLFDGDAPIGRRELPGLARLSRRAMRGTVDGLERLGWVTVGCDAEREPSVAVSLTAPARRARDAWRPLAVGAEDRWRRRFGPPWLDALRDGLERLVQQLDLELPHYPTGYGPADVSITGAAGPAAGTDPEKLRATRRSPWGTDWSPVPRGNEDSVTGLPLSALLSQALVAFAIDYERHGLGPLVNAANILRNVGDAGVPFGDLPRLAGVTGNGKSALERHGLVVVDAAASGREGRSARLTALGRRCRDAYEPLVEKIEAHWAERYGEDIVAILRDTLEAVDPHLDPALPDFPIVVFVSGLGFIDMSHQAG